MQTRNLLRLIKANFTMIYRNSRERMDQIGSQHTGLSTVCLMCGRSVGPSEYPSVAVGMRLLTVLGLRVADDNLV
jgi:hypothetical protein